MPLLSVPLALRAADLANPRDIALIDEYVRRHAQATPFHLPAWIIAVARGCGQKAHCLIAERASGAITGILPLVEIGSPLFGRAMVSSGFGVGGGILANEENATALLADAGWALATARRCPTMELRGGPVPGPEWSVDTTTYLGFVRDLAADDEAELIAIPRKQRAEVRKALAADLEVTQGRNPSDLKAHYQVYAESVRNLGTPVFPARLFREVMREFGESADIVTVRHQGRAVAGVLSLYMNDIVYPFWGGGTHAARGLRANERLYFALMRRAHARGCTRFDFGRSKAGTGVAAFKKNFGFEPVPLAYATRTAAGAAPREMNPLSPRYRMQVAAWRSLPLWIANRAGPIIARGLG